jgi:hypothetical protein
MGNAWRLDAITVIDSVVGGAPVGGGVSVGTYLGLAALSRVCELKSKRAFADWWTKTALGRITRIRLRRWITAGSGTRYRGPAGTDRGGVDPADDRGVRPGHPRVDPGHDQLRDVHRLGQRPGANRGAGQGQAETLRPAHCRSGVGRDPRRWQPAALAPTRATRSMSPSLPR